MRPHFTRVELAFSSKAIELNIDNTPPESVIPALDRTIAGLERVRLFLDHPMIITSGYRCPELNAAVGGVVDSQHLRGEAADFVCPQYGEPVRVVLALMPLRRCMDIDQLIMEGSWIHISFSASPRHQVLRLMPNGHYERMT
jgi:zinc D-Ala-D-Ala carboxypeptidase